MMKTDALFSPWLRLKPVSLLAVRFLCLAALLLAGSHVFAQSCAMCYTTAAGGGAGVIRALKGGILVLAVPPVLLFTGLVSIVARWRTNEPEAEPDADPQERPWPPLS